MLVNKLKIKRKSIECPILNEEGTKIFQNVGKIHQSTRRDIEKTRISLNIAVINPNLTNIEGVLSHLKGNLFIAVKKIMLIYQKVNRIVS